MSFKPIEPKRDEFRRYLERSGIIEALTKVFSKLIDEENRPENPLEYIRDHLGDAVLQSDNIAHLHAELEDAKSEIARLRSLVNSVNNGVEVLESSENADSDTEKTVNNELTPNSNIDQSQSDENLEQNSLESKDE